MKQLFAVFKKELVDNLRDKRSVFFALLYGPVLLPLMMIGPMAMGVKKHTVNFDRLHTVYMVEPERAVNFQKFMREKNIDIQAVEGEFKQRILDQELNLVIELSPEYEEALRSGKAASVRLYYNKKSDSSEKSYRKVSSAIRQYNSSIAALRLELRGLDASFLSPIRILEEDLAEVDRGAKAISMLLPFIIVLSLTMGGFYLAVDSTAGERERHSLESLLSLYISRTSLVLGKLLTLMVFVSTSALLAVISCYLMFAFIPVKALTSLLQVNVGTFASIFLICLPLVPFFSAAMMLIATYAKNTKEAQTHLGLSMMLPMAPFFVLQFANVQSNEVLYWVPVMSQFLLIEQFVAEEIISNTLILQSAGGTLVLAGVFLLTITSLYKKESILGS